MKAIEVTGRTLIQFESSDCRAKNEFETVMASEQAYEELAKAFLSAAARIEKQKREAWASAKALVSQHLGREVKDLRYDWILGAFEVIE